MDSSLDNGDTSFVDNGETSFETTELSDQVDINQICRLCANAAELTIPIFEEEGLEHDLKTKIAQYLPIKVKETDKLPTKLCYQCASTIVAWHDLFDGCFEAEKKLKDLIGDDSPCSYEEETYGTVENSLTDFIKIKPKGDTLPSRSKSVRLESIKKYQYFQFTLNIPQTGENDQINSYCLICGSQMMNLHSLKTHLSLNHNVNSNLNRASPSSVARSIKPEYLLYTLDLTKTTLKKMCFCMVCGDIENNFHTLISHLSHKHKMHAHLNFDDDTVQSQNTQCNENRGKGNDDSKQIRAKKTSSSEIDTGMPSGKRNQFEFSRRKNAEELDQRKDRVKDLKSGIKTRSLRSQRIKQYRERQGLSKGVDNDQNQSEHVATKGLVNDQNQCTPTKVIVSTLDAQPTQRKRSRMKPKKNEPALDLFRCNICSKLIRKCNSSRHLKRHTGQRPHSCELCEKRFFTRNEVSTHVRRVHERNPLQCTDCKEVFGSLAELTAHRKSTHFTEVNAVCELCGKAYHSRHAYTYHILAHRISESKHRCELCDRRFVTRDKLVIHMRRHAGEETTRFQCSECGNRFTQSSSLNAHMKNIHLREKRHHCPICGRGFFKRYYVAKHIDRIHRRQEPDEEGDSDECSGTGLEDVNFDCSQECEVETTI